MTLPQRSLLWILPFAYLLGSVPFGLIVGLSRGIDPRKAGSGNIGATNLGRLLGGRYFALVFVLDLLKGLLPMLAAAMVLRNQTRDWQTYVLWLMVGFAAILGHMFSIFIGFKGGKGVATSTGVVLGLFPYFTLPGLAAAMVWGVLFKITRYVSLASIVGVMVFPLAYLAIGLLWRPPWPVAGEQLPLLIFSTIMAFLIVVKHRSNVSRLLAGTENRFGQKKPLQPDPASKT